LRWFFGAGALALLIIGMTGALNALGDTLFPAASLSEGFEADFAAGAHFLVRLRILHPLVAVAAGLLVLVLAARMSEGTTGVVRRAGVTVMVLVGIQMFAGIANLLLLTPLASQLLHLFLADVLWIAFVVLGAAVAGERARAPAPAP
jgi:heme A synthase